MFKVKMNELKGLSIEAHDYMAAIPPSAWSRHAFDTICKSNMLLNNMCESFNAVMKPARDKPILTLMEWMRRYIMQRHHSKREGLLALEDGLLPYVKKQFDWAKEAYKGCVVRVASSTLFEVDFKDQTCLVDLAEKTCTCYRWQLTGLPCHHAYATIMESRGNPEEFVHDYYSRASYAKAYAPIIRPMPGPSDWETTQHTQPDPPPFRKLPGRPSRKKRRLEPDEKGSKKKKKIGGEKVGREVGKKSKCSVCKQLGHNKRKCTSTKPSQVPESKGKGGRPLQEDPFVELYRAKRLKSQSTTQDVNDANLSQASTVVNDAEYPDSLAPACV
jgi:hypothetical protein